LHVDIVRYVYAFAGKVGVLLKSFIDLEMNPETFATTTRQSAGNPMFEMSFYVYDMQTPIYVMYTLMKKKCIERTVATLIPG